MSNKQSQSKYERAFNIVVKYGFCRDCRWPLDSKYCPGHDCYDQVKLLREAVDHMKEPKPAYRGYTATVEYDEDDKLWYGTLDGIKDLVNFHAFEIENIEQSFHDAVDDYLDFCARVGKEPERPRA